ncbi:MAG: hypothetical protein IPN63_12850 [Gammaproteobacteria bacterium]|nr:hypothetical protein [Gammaproteobacteria bacterium]
MKTRWIGLIACLVFGPAQAASFDCHKAQTEVEKLICTDAELSAQDEALARAYKDAAKRTAEPDRYKREQRTWNKAREECLGESDKAACLKDKYTRRVQALSGNCWRHKPWWFGKSQVSGADWPMCKIMLENLNRFCGDGPQSLQCEPQLDPGITSLRTPEWQSVDPKDHLDWIADYVKWRLGPNRGPDETRWKVLKPKIQRRLDEGLVQIWQARFDATNDGVPELVMRVDLGCDPVLVVGPDEAQYTTANAFAGMVDEQTRKLDTRYLTGAHFVFNAGKTYRLRIGETEMGLVEPFGGYRGGYQGLGAVPVYGETTVCMFERITN